MDDVPPTFAAIRMWFFGPHLEAKKHVAMWLELVVIYEPGTQWRRAKEMPRFRGSELVVMNAHLNFGFPVVHPSELYEGLQTHAG